MSDPGPALRRVLWPVTALVAGGLVMALEMAGFRLFAPHFGNSITIWGNLISVVMAALALGYALGGQLADRNTTDTALYLTILASAVWQIGVLFTYRPLLVSFAGQGEVLGSALASLVLLAPPMVALATVGPYLIRLLATLGHVGTTAGRVYALSTVGSIGGVLLTTFVLVPRLGTRGTLLVIAACTVLLATAGLVRRRPAAAALLAVLGLLPAAPDRAWTPHTLWAGESVYNLVRVAERGERLALILNHPRSLHTLRDPDGSWTNRYYDDFALGPSLVRAERALVLGMGAGGSVQATWRVAPDLPFDGVEIDPLVVEAAARFFDLAPGPLLQVHVADARPWLSRGTTRYDLVHLDLFSGGASVPFYLNTVEFHRQVRARMTDDALLMINVFDLGPGRTVLNATAATLAEVFPSLFVLPRPRQGNHLVLAFTRTSDLETVRARLAGADASLDPLRAPARLAPLVSPDGTPVLTDDHAPLEQLTRAMLAAAGPARRQAADADDR